MRPVEQTTPFKADIAEGMALSFTDISPVDKLLISEYVSKS